MWMAKSSYKARETAMKDLNKKLARASAKQVQCKKTIESLKLSYNNLLFKVHEITKEHGKTMTNELKAFMSPANVNTPRVQKVMQKLPREKNCRGLFLEWYKVASEASFLLVALHHAKGDDEILNKRSSMLEQSLRGRAEFSQILMGGESSLPAGSKATEEKRRAYLEAIRADQEMALVEERDDMTEIGSVDDAFDAMTRGEYPDEEVVPSSGAASGAGAAAQGGSKPPPSVSSEEQFQASLRQSLADSVNSGSDSMKKLSLEPMERRAGTKKARKKSKKYKEMEDFDEDDEAYSGSGDGMLLTEHNDGQAGMET